MFFGKKLRKEKRDNMKKLLSTIAILLLLISAIEVTFNIAPVTIADGTWHLDIFTSPAVVMSYIPGGIIGTGDYPPSWSGPITAPLVVNKTDVENKTQYWFDHWEFNGTSQGGSWNAPENTKTIGPYNAGNYVNATAVYKIVHKLTIITPFGTPQVEPGHIDFWYWDGGTAHACLDIGYKWVMYGEQWFFDYWTGDASGSNFACSDDILMDGPKTAQAVWYVQYYLEWHSYEWNDGIYVGPGTYSGANWYNESLTIPLSAPQIGHSGGNWRYLFDHWDKDGVFYSTDQNINVHMDAPHNMSAHYIGQDYITFNDYISGSSCVSTLSGWYNWSTTYTFTPPAGAPIPAGAGIQFRWAWWDENGVYFSPNLTIQYHVKGPATLTARYQTQYYVKLDMNPPLGTIVEIKGSDIIGPAPIEGWFDSGSTIYFLVPDVAELVPGDHMWKFDTDVGKAWWLNGVYWGPGGWWNASWRFAGYGPLNQPINVTANYKKYYYVEWDTDPTGLGWKGSAWYPEGIMTTGYTTFPPGSVGTLVFKRLYDNDIPQPVGVNLIWLDGGSLNQSHTVIAEYVNKTSFYIVSPPPFTAPKECTNFTVTVWAANFDIERGRDLYAMDFHIYYNATLIKLVKWDYTDQLNNLWGVGKWFVAKEETFYDAANGYTYFWFVATALKDAVGFTGSKPVLTLTFHVELDPCYPIVYSTPIDFSTKYPTKLTNSTGDVITPELTYGATYTISAPQPIVQIELDKTPIRRNVPQETFDAYVNIKLGIKVTDFYIKITYPNTLIEPINVTFGDYLPGPAFTSRGYIFDKWSGIIYVWCTEDPSSPKGYGNGTLFIIEFKVIKATFWQNPDLTGGITIDKSVSYLSVCCPNPKYQYFNPDVIVYDAVYRYVPLPGDLNFDGMVNVVDLRLLAGKYGLTVGTGNPYDVNRDGNVDIVDLVLVALHFGDHI
jgi:hypothetical protein